MHKQDPQSASIVLPPGTPFRHHRRQRIHLRSSSYSIYCFHPNRRHPSRHLSTFVTPSNPKPKTYGIRIDGMTCRLNIIGHRGGDGRSKGGDEGEEYEEVDKALRLEGTIPGSSNEFVDQVSSHAYDMRRHLQQAFDSSSYNGWIAKFGEIDSLQHSQENQILYQVSLIADFIILFLKVAYNKKGKRTMEEL